jgi:hypothetical protein
MKSGFFGLLAATLAIILTGFAYGQTSPETVKSKFDAELAQAVGAAFSFFR